MIAKGLWKGRIGVCLMGVKFQFYRVKGVIDWAVIMVAQ